MLVAHQQFAKNLVQMRGMLAQAKTIAPRKFRGYTVSQLEEHVARLEACVLMSDAEMTEYLSPENLKARAAALMASKR